MNKPSEAINDYLQALERGGDAESINPKLMPLYLKVDQFQEAKQTAEILLKNEENNPNLFIAKTIIDE